MPANETWNKRVQAPIHWGLPYRWDCLTPRCENKLIVERIEEGQIWECHLCRGLHEFYSESVGTKTGNGWVRYGVVRLLVGVHRRDSSEPKITEFIEDVKP